jgi:hypothetical protein
MGEIRNANQMLVEKPERKRELGRSRWRYTIKMTLKEIGCDRTRWWALANTIMNLRDPQKVRNLIRWATTSSMDIA